MCLWTRLECKWGHMCCMHFSCGNIMIEFGLATQVTSYAWQGDGTTSQCWCQNLGKDWSWLKMQVEGACENSGDLAESMIFFITDKNPGLLEIETLFAQVPVSYWRPWRNKPPVPHNNTNPCRRVAYLCPGWEGPVLNPCLSLEGLKLPVEGWLVVITMSMYFAHPPVY